jgi:hypothetical protein
MADILKILLIILGILAVYVSYWLLAEALFPGLVQRASECYRSPVRITLIGLAAAAPPVVLGLVLANLPNPLMKLLGITLLVVPALLGLVGSAIVCIRQLQRERRLGSSSPPSAPPMISPNPAPTPTPVAG